MVSMPISARSPNEFAAAGYIAAAPDLFWRHRAGRSAHDDSAQQNVRSRGWRRSRPENAT